MFVEYKGYKKVSPSNQSNPTKYQFVRQTHLKIPEIIHSGI
jgi:hypothetical protein